MRVLYTAPSAVEEEEVVVGEVVRAGRDLLLLGRTGGVLGGLLHLHVERESCMVLVVLVVLCSVNSVK